MADDLQGPIIPLLIDNTIDPQTLNGNPLQTYAKYDHLALGDVLIQNWLGRAEDGRAIDVTDLPIDVDPSQVEEHGFPMAIAYNIIERLDKGQVFYSFFLERATGEPKEESKRIHFGIGKVGLVSAPQIKESHDHQLDPDGIEGTSITIAVVPYTAMSSGDVVKLFWAGTRADGRPGPIVGPFVKTLSDTDTDPTNNPGQVLSWTVPKTSVVALRGGSITLHYEIIYAASAAQPNTLSAERMIGVSAPTEPELAAPTVKGLIGTVINPGPDGIRVVIPIYPAIRSGDDVLVYGTRVGAGAGLNKNIIAHLKVDRSAIDSGRLEVPIGAQWLLDNRGGAVVLRYQYARADAAGSGVPLELTVREPLILPTPTVDRSVLVGGRSELDPMMAYNDAFITIPPSATIGEGDEVIAYWKGFGDSGSSEIQVPSQLEPMKFRVPASVLPPNFGRTVEVTYSVAGQDAEPALQLFIRRLSDHPGIRCQGMQIGSPATLKFSDIPTNGALVTVERWPFMSTEQVVRVWLNSNAIPEREIIALRQVQPEECTSGVTGRLLASHLDGIALNSTFTLRASVSFDSGHTTVVFNNPLSLKLLA